MQDRAWTQHYDEGVPASIDYEELCVPHFLERSAREHPDALALVFLGRKLTYRQLLDQTRRMATALARLGVEPGQRIAIQLPNLPQTVIAYQAALAIGAQVVLTNPLYTTPEIEHQWRDAECELAITTDFIFEEKIRAHQDELPPSNYIIASIPDYLPWPLRWIAPFKLKRQTPKAWARVKPGRGIHFFRELVSQTPPSPPDVEVRGEDVAVLQYTGGTTGVSKAAILTHRNLSVNVQQVSTWLCDRRDAEDAVLVCLPLFHVFGMTVGMNMTLHDGAAMILVPNPRDIGSVVRNLVRYRATIFPGVPALFNAIGHYEGVERLDLSNLRHCVSGSAPISEDVLNRFEKLSGARIIEGFGLSETSPVTHVNPLHGLRKIGSIGIPVPDTEARIVDAEEGERELPTGEEGELVIRGPQVMRGYWNQPEETANALRNGWFYTGDLARQDEDGFFTIVGRKKDMINCNGLKVYPDEVDEVLISHPAVLEAATIGVPHPRRIELVKSFVVLHEGRKVDKRELTDFCRDKLAKYKVPTEIEFLDELPKSTVMKVLRRELRERELENRARRKGGDVETGGADDAE